VTIGGKHPWALGRPAAEVWSARCPQSPLDAFKYTFEGEIRVTMKPSPRDGRVEFSVEDTGIGIPASELRGRVSVLPWCRNWSSCMAAICGSQARSARAVLRGVGPIWRRAPAGAKCGRRPDFVLSRHAHPRLNATRSQKPEIASSRQRCDRGRTGSRAHRPIGNSCRRRLWIVHSSPWR
jgi:hypothetical protein